jgi:hypothetical protein
MSAFLEWLQSSLVVDVETHDDQAPDSPIVTRFTVRNKATISDGKPEIFFEEVALTVGVPPDMHVEKHTNLAGGESFAYEHHCRYSDLGKIVYSIDGKISPSRLLRVGQSATTVSPRKAFLSIASYVEVLKDLNINKWLTGVIEAMVLPETGIGQAETKALQDKFRNAAKEIGNTRSQLENIYGFIERRNDTDRQNVTNHRTLIDKYLTHTDQACGELRKMLETHNARTIESARDKLVIGLSEEANRIDEASQRLLK